MPANYPSYSQDLGVIKSNIYRYKPKNVPEVDEIECSLDLLKKVQDGKFCLNYSTKDSDKVLKMNISVYLDGFVNDNDEEKVNIAVTLQDKIDKVIETIPAEEFFDNFMENTFITDAGNIYNNKYVKKIVNRHIDEIKQEMMHVDSMLFDIESDHIVLFSSNNIPVETYSGSIDLSFDMDTRRLLIDNNKQLNETIMNKNGYFVVCPIDNKTDAYLIKGEFSSSNNEHYTSVTFGSENWEIITYDKFIELNGGEPDSITEKETEEEYNTEDKYEIEW